MRQSRYVWLLGISLLCLITIIVLQTPQTVISTLANPQHGNSPRTTIQHFWNLMDLRQTDLAQDLLSLPEGSSDENEFKTWAAKLNKDPMLSLQKVEFMNSDSDITHPLIVRVSWTSPTQEVESATFSITLKAFEKGWCIEKFKQVTNSGL